MSTIEKMLLDLAVESGDVIEEHAGNPEEITVITDNTTSELEEELEELGEKIKDSNRELDQVLEASDAIVSAESMLVGHINQMRDVEHAGEYNRTVQRLTWDSIVDSMEAYKFPEAIYSSITDDIAFEAEESVAQAEADAVKGEGILKRIWNMLVIVANAAKNLYTKFLDLFRNTNETNKKANVSLKANIASREGEASKEEFKTSSYSDLVANDTVDAKGAVQATIKGHIGHIVTLDKSLSDVMTSVNKILTAGANGGTDKLASAVNSAAGADVSKLMDSSELLVQFFSELKDFNFDLHGGSKVEFTKNAKVGKASKIGFNISKVTATAPATSPVPSLADLSEIVTVLEIQNKTIDSVNASMAESAKLTDELIKQAKALAEAETKEEDKKIIEMIVKTTNVLITSSKGILPKYNSKVIQTGRSAYKYAQAAANLYPKKAKA